MGRDTVGLNVVPCLLTFFLVVFQFAFVVRSFVLHFGKVGIELNFFAVFSFVLFYVGIIRHCHKWYTNEYFCLVLLVLLLLLFGLSFCSLSSSFDAFFGDFFFHCSSFSFLRPCNNSYLLATQPLPIMQP